MLRLVPACQQLRESWTRSVGIPHAVIKSLFRHRHRIDRFSCDQVSPKIGMRRATDEDAFVWRPMLGTFKSPGPLLAVNQQRKATNAYCPETQIRELCVEIVGERIIVPAADWRDAETAVKRATGWLVVGAKKRQVHQSQTDSDSTSSDALRRIEPIRRKKSDSFELTVAATRRVRSRSRKLSRVIRFPRRPLPDFIDLFLDLEGALNDSHSFQRLRPKAKLLQFKLLKETNV